MWSIGGLRIAVSMPVELPIINLMRQEMIVSLYGEFCIQIILRYLAIRDLGVTQISTVSKLTAMEYHRFPLGMFWHCIVLGAFLG